MGELEKRHNDALMYGGEWQPMEAYTEGDRVTHDGIEYELTGGRFVPVGGKPRRKVGPKVLYLVVPFLLIALDLWCFTWAFIKSWEILRPYVACWYVIAGVNFAGLAYFMVGFLSDDAGRPGSK